MVTTLDRLPVKSGGVITKVGGAGALRLRLLDMGLIPRTKVKVYKIAPLGDPMEIQLRGYLLTIRKEDAGNIEVEIMPDNQDENTEDGNGRKKDREDGKGRKSSGKGGERT